MASASATSTTESITNTVSDAINCESIYYCLRAVGREVEGERRREGDFIAPACLDLPRPNDLYLIYRLHHTLTCLQTSRRPSRASPPSRRRRATVSLAANFHVSTSLLLLNHFLPPACRGDCQGQHQRLHRRPHLCRCRRHWQQGRRVEAVRPPVIPHPGLIPYSSLLSTATRRRKRTKLLRSTNRF